MTLRMYMVVVQVVAHFCQSSLSVRQIRRYHHVPYQAGVQENAKNDEVTDMLHHPEHWALEDRTLAFPVASRMFDRLHPPVQAIWMQVQEI